LFIIMYNIISDMTFCHACRKLHFSEMSRRMKFFYNITDVVVNAVRCLEDPEMEEYVDELEGLVESLSDDEHVEKEHIFTEQFYGQCTHHARRDDRQKTFYVINHSEVENAKSQSLLQSFQAQLESDIIEMIVVHQNGDGLIIFPEYNESI
ncbi:hypothetical protein T10_10754, partial [Trichinella papuae]